MSAKVKTPIPKEDVGVKQPVSPPPPPVQVDFVDMEGKVVEPEISCRPILPSDEKIKENIEDREAAETVLDMIACEFPKQGNRFWEVLRDEGIKRAGMPMKPEIKDLAVFDDKRAEVFMKQIFPRGKYAEMTVLAVEKKEGLEFLERFATKPDFFQRGLSRYVEWRKKHPLKKAKKKKGKKK